MDTLDAMKIFVRVADTANFAETARQLDVAPATVTRAVQSLERRLSARLFHRSTRSVRLTDDGRRYLDAAKLALTELLAAEDAVRSTRARQVVGTLRLTMPTALGTRFIVPLLAEFRERHPELHLDLDFSDGAMDLVASGFDAAIRVATQLPDSSFAARRIATSPAVITGAPSYLARHGMPQNLADLMQHVQVQYAHPFGPPGPLAAGPAAAPVRVNSGDALKSFALAGHGLVRTPAFVVADELASGRLVQVLPQVDLGEFVVHVLFAERNLMPLRLRHLIDFLSSRLGPLAPPAPGRRPIPSPATP
jgi:DNA-binding transcriptional LysR family regulator